MRILLARPAGAHLTDVVVHGSGPPAVSREELADFLCADRQSATRALNDLREADGIERTSTTIRDRRSRDPTAGNAAGGAKQATQPADPFPGDEGSALSGSAGPAPTSRQRPSPTQRRKRRADAPGADAELTRKKRHDAASAAMTRIRIQDAEGLNIPAATVGPSPRMSRGQGDEASIGPVSSLTGDGQLSQWYPSTTTY